MVINMEKENKFIKVVQYMKDIRIKMKQMVKVGTFTAMEISNS